VRVLPILAVCFGVAGLGLLGGSAAAAPPVALGPPATADGLAVQIIGPDGTITTASSEGTAPPDSVVQAGTFAYPGDGSIVSAASTDVTATASATDGTSSVTTELSALSLFAGEITADDVTSTVTSSGTVGDLSDSIVKNLSVFGAPSLAVANWKIPLEDWGYLLTLTESTETGAEGRPSWRGTVTGLVVHLNADHGGLPAGSEIRIGFANAYSRPPEKTATTTTVTTTAAPKTTTASPKPSPTPTPTTTRSHPQLPQVLPPPTSGVGAGTQGTGTKHKKGEGPVILSPPTVTPKLTAGGYVFPVYGPSGYSDTFGAARADVSGGWHHGDDIFAPLGAPILAVATGTVFSVGWNEIGGWRLWLRDQAGNEFYYAHLSAYSKLAVNGMHVRAGQVLGFVGNTGDAQGTPFHLHFEVHPVSMLFLGYDGAVDPTKYLDAWKRLEDVRILPAVPFSQPQADLSASSAAVPAPGAILLESSDISTANGLDPASLKRAMNGPATVDVTGTGLGQLPTPLPNLDRA
jgi:murein DD-endopeptidase MepM/ murein hydrolase activator NlpD